jgi:hypothetical protein
VHGRHSGRCGGSTTEREFPSDNVYRRDDRGIVRVESLIPQGLAFFVIHTVLDAAPCVPFRCIHRLGVGVGIFGIDGMPGIGDMLGLFSIGIFMSFIMEAQQSFDWVAVKGASAFIMWWQSLGCAKMR